MNDYTIEHWKIGQTVPNGEMPHPFQWASWNDPFANEDDDVDVGKLPEKKDGCFRIAASTDLELRMAT